MKNIIITAILFNIIASSFADARETKTFSINGKSITVEINENASERVFWVYKWLVMTNMKSIYAYMKSPGFDFRKEVILEESPLNPPAGMHTKSDSEFIAPPVANEFASIVKYLPNEIGVKCGSPEGGFLVFSEIYYPGWKAYIDGKSTKIFRANALFRAIYVPEGMHTIQLFFRPISLYIGAAITAMTFVAIGIALFYIRRKRIPDTEKRVF